eukprot:SAG31_NODE_1680_length_7539_cov_29.860484_8_plen_56_part_00
MVNLSGCVQLVALDGRTTNIFVPGELRHSDSDQQRTPPLSLLYTVVLSHFLFKFM